MGVKSDVQGLSPGSIVELYELDATALGGEVYRFHPHIPATESSTEGKPALSLEFTQQDYQVIPYQPIPTFDLDFRTQEYQVDDVGPLTPNQIAFQGLVYDAWPMESAGFEQSGTAKQPQPRVTLGNVNGYISSLVIYFNDMVGAKLTRKRTLSKYLDGASAADRTQEMPPEVWYIERKALENDTHVQFELSSPLNFQGQQLPRGQIIANSCRWLTIGGYRGPYCGYNGPPVATEYDIITTDASRDKCGGLVRSCKMRFGADNPLPYGSYPAAGLIR